MGRNPGRRHRLRDEGPLGSFFWTLWAASTFSSLGNGLSSVALPLLAATLTHRPLLVAAVLFVGRIPWLVVALPAGAYADRVDRPRLMLLMDLVRAGLLVCVAVLVATNTITIALVYAFAFAVGVCDTFFSGSTQAVLPAIVDKSNLHRANGLLSVGRTTTEQTAGPAIGGTLFSLSRTIPFAADAVSFVGSAALLLGLGRSQPPQNRQNEPPIAALASDLWADMKAGIAWYRHSTALCAVTGTVAVLAFSQAMVSSILVLFALERLHLGDAGYGLFMAGVAVGNIVGGLLATRLTYRIPTATVVVAATVLAAVGYLGTGVTASPYLAAGLLSLEAVAVAFGNIATISFRQRATPAELQARIANVWRSVVWGAIPFGAAAGGALGAAVGLRAPFFVAGSLQLLLAAVMARPLHRLLHPAPGPASWRGPAGEVATELTVVTNDEQVTGA